MPVHVRWPTQCAMSDASRHPGRPCHKHIQTDPTPTHLHHTPRPQPQSWPLQPECPAAGPPWPHSHGAGPQPALPPLPALQPLHPPSPAPPGLMGPACCARHRPMRRGSTAQVCGQAWGLGQQHSTGVWAWGLVRQHSLMKVTNSAGASIPACPHPIRC